VTVIATDGKSMAGDGLTTECDTIISMTTIKVERLPCGGLFGSAGDCASGDAIRDWIVKDGDTDTPTAGHARALYLTRDGEIYLYDTDSIDRPTKCSAPMAIGSGMDYALGAMDAGASAAIAVSVAMGRCPTCGGKVTDIAL